MDSSHIALFCLIGIVAAQQFHIHKLVNKIMSKNYYDYIQTTVMGKDKPKPAENPKIPVNDEDFEDLGYLNQI